MMKTLLVSFKKLNSPASQIYLALNEICRCLLSSSVFPASNATPSVNRSEETCYELISDYDGVLEQTHFWIKGVALTTLGVFGLLGNMVTIAILSKSDSNR